MKTKKEGKVKQFKDSSSSSHMFHVNHNKKKEIFHVNSKQRNRSNTTTCFKSIKSNGNVIIKRDKLKEMKVIPI